MKRNVLVFSAAQYPGIQVCRWLHDSMLFHPIAAASFSNHSRFIAEDYIDNLPFVLETSFVDTLNVIIKERKIEFIIPTDDTIAVVLTENMAKIKAQIVCSPYETAKLCRYKSLTYEALRGLSFVPKVYTQLNDAQYNDFPLFAKLDNSQGSQGTKKIENRDEMKNILESDKKMVLCEYLPGEEYTVDCFTNRNGALLFMNPRRRVRIQYGVSVRAESVDDPTEFIDIIQQIKERITFRGYWFVQLKRDKNGNLKLMELCTRFSGTFAHSQGYGVNLPVLALCDFAGMDVSVIKNNYKIISDKSFIDRYQLDFEYSRIYVDYDDTITSCGGDAVHAPMMAYLYQCKNKGYEIILLTRHFYSKGSKLLDDMKRLAIPSYLFDQIIELSWDQEKYQVVNTEKLSIFIDNSFTERKKVAERHKIPVFDVAHIECLFDWR
jgi:hypothetical protein